MTFYFWVSTVLTAALVIVAGVIAYFKEDRMSMKWWVSLIPVGGAICGMALSYHSQKEADRLQDTVNARHQLYSSNFKKTFDSIHVIIDTLKLALEQTKVVLSNQNVQGGLLNEQIRNTRSALGATEDNLIKSENTLRELSRINSPINKIRLRIGLEFAMDDNNYIGDASKRKTHDEIVSLEMSMLFDKKFKNIKYSESKPTSKKAYYDEGVFLLKDFNKSNDSTLYSLSLINHTTVSQRGLGGYLINESKYDMFFPVISMYMLYFFKSNKSYVEGKFDPKAYSMRFLARGESGKVFYTAKSIDFVKRTIYESMEVDLDKEFSDNSLVSPLDFKNKQALLGFWVEAKAKLKFLEIQSGDNYSNELRLNLNKNLFEKGGNSFLIKF
jgi:hypothetical protein